MSKLFSKIGKLGMEKFDLKIQVLLHTLQINSKQDMEDVTIKFQRGPQTDETRRYELEKGENNLELA
jgi:hypothetical protein